MADHAAHDLKYGHFGQILYNPDEKSWLSNRHLCTRYVLRPLGSSQTVVKSHLAHQDHHDVTKERPNVHLRRQITSLATLQPALTPALDILGRAAVVSSEIEKAVCRHDPTYGQLLAYGRIPDDATKRSMPIAAFPAADHPHTLRFVQVQPQKHGWEHNKSIWIDVPRIHGESGTWHAAAPVRQVCFAHASEDSALSQVLAVRTTVGVSVLRLMARRSPASWDSTENVASRIDPILLCTLALDACGGVPPAHVAFNHWYAKQFATVDQQGTWRVWDTSLKQNSTDHGKPVELCRGATNDRLVSEDVAAATLLDDGWGRVAWAGNAQTIITASRRCLGIYDIQGKPVRLSSPNLGISGTPHWILDIQANPLDHSLVFVLTSVALFCLRLRCLDEHDSESYNTAGAEVVLQCRHFRDPEDISLRLSSYTDDQDLVVVIKSSLGLTATSYRFFSDDTSSPPLLKVSDPALINLPELSSAPASSNTLTLDLQLAEFGESTHHGQSSGLGKSYQDISLKFYIATIITSNMSVVQKLYYASPSSQADHNIVPNVLPPDWRGRMVHSNTRLKILDFVEGNAKHKERLSGRGEETLQKATLFAKSLSQRSGRDNWMMIYDRSHARTTNAISQTEDLSQIIARIKETRDTTQAADEGHRLLSELCQDQIIVPDIDEATAEFRLLTASSHSSGDEQTSQPFVTLAQIADGTVLGVHLDQDMDLTAVYDSLVACWLSPLSQSIPGRVRLVKEQLARRVAADICLASHALRLPPVETAEEETQPVESRLTQHESSIAHPESSLPTPSPTATPSLTTATSLSSHPSTLVSPEFARLQRYTTFASDKSTPAPLPKSLANMLAHWSLGGNPDEYDWLVVQREQERKAEEEDEDLTPKERARLKRRAEKLLRKQRRETEKAFTMDVVNSQAPEIVSTTQPSFATPARRGAGDILPAFAATQGTPVLASSQSQPQQNMFLSQVEAGRHGGRPAKKKRRLVGF